VNAEPVRLAILEALLFVAEEPLPLPKLQEILGDAEPGATEASLHDLAVGLETDGRGLMVQEVAGGFRLATRPEVHAWVQRLQQVRPARLSRAALETLAIVAYRQPITRAEIEAIRGVAVDGVLRTLLERELVRMMGRKPEAGRPMLYGTSQQFLEHFGLRELGDLPTLREINELIGITEGGASTHPPSDGPQPAAEARQPGVEPGSDVDGPVVANEAPEGSPVLASPPGDDRAGTASPDAARAAATGASADQSRGETSD
jgi:segregation and condensation protein B